MLASVQVPVTRGLYLRPGVGVSRHAFATFTSTQSGVLGQVSHEMGPAGELAAGTVLGAGRSLGVAVEGFALLSGGEDSTGARWAAGLRVVPSIHF